MTTSESPSAYDDVRRILAREWGSVVDLLGTVDDAWQRPTRLSGWSVADLARHVVWGVSMEADALHRGRAGVGEVAQGHLLADGTGRDEVVQALINATTGLYAEVAALAPEHAALICPMPHGETPVSLALDIFVFEAGIHASDFAHAAGRHRPLAEDLVPAVATVLDLFLPAFATSSTVAAPPTSSFSLRGDTVRLDGVWTDAGLQMGPVDQAPTWTVTGDDSSVLLFAVGRLDVDEPRLAVTGSAELARDFKEHVPGP
jgi:uncharacterized protein (TIGR03083 family)